MDIQGILYPVLSLGGLGLAFGLGLGYAGVKFKVEEDPNLPLVRDALPGANCGGCGFAGCDAFAAAVVAGTAKPNGCPVGGSESTIKISEILGIEAEIAERIVAFVRCGGNCEKAKFQYDYFGMNDCMAAMHLAAGGSKACTYGCLGVGSCKAACKFGAMQIVDGIAKVDKEKCTACGKCVEVCPKKLIELIPYKNTVHVLCNSTDNGKTVKSNCSTGCIGCKICEKSCGYDAIHVTKFLAKIDYGKCTMCNECVQKCPTHAIKN